MDRKEYFGNKIVGNADIFSFFTPAPVVSVLVDRHIMQFHRYMTSCVICRQKNELEGQLRRLEGSAGDSKLLLEGQRKELMSLNEALAKQQVSWKVSRFGWQIQVSPMFLPTSEFRVKYLLVQIYCF